MNSLGIKPTSLFPLEFGHKGILLNMMLYDCYHGNGYKLDMLTGYFVEDKPTTQTKGTTPCNQQDTSKET